MPISRRRFLLTGAGAVGVIGAGGSLGALLGTQRDVAPEPFAAPAAPQALTRALAREQSLIAAHTAVMAAHPELSTRLAPIVADHTAHLDVLAAEWARITQATALPTPNPSAATSVAPTPDPVGALRAAEQAAANEAAADCLDFQGPTLGADEAGSDNTEARLAVLLGCISASETVHVRMLG